MFMAVELSSNKPLDISVIHPGGLANIRAQLQIAETLPRFKRAFPDDDGSFLANFDAVALKESQRPFRTRARTNVETPHLPRVRFSLHLTQFVH